jgi:RHH-type proline utilization regulon transcriptional repressor/proline dehydrogenase/delta 1-pyrroline-5-carboxylate dehydrogenase
MVREYIFRNEPFSDFSVPAVRSAFADALRELEHRAHAGLLVAAPCAGGRALNFEGTIPSVDPSLPEFVLGQVQLAGISAAEDAVKILVEAFPKWRATPYQERAACLMRMAEFLRDDRASMAALIIREAGKPWAEADGDIAEAIDFCTYYATEMLKLGAPQKMGDVPGELNHYFYQPRGIGLVIAPWNFPCAIALGMAVAGLVTGNCVILKPSEQTSLVAARLVEMLYAAGIPKDVLAFLPGKGEVVGAHLVTHPKIDFVCFTGSKAVGLDIIKRASVTQTGQMNVRRVVAEMGGKNAIIVDEDADLDEAIKGVLKSAFGYAGQKCSACSRAIIVGSAYEPFIKRLSEAAADIIVGAASDSATMLPPVIDGEAQKRILGIIDRAERELTLAFKGNVPPIGYFVPPTIFKDVPASSFLWREEVFGPVLACTSAHNFEEALHLANDSEYALTGAIFSRSPANLERARIDFRVGNLYINRGSTGALVYRQPFGGFKMSGIGSKAGGPDYLLQFMEPRVITENTMRRGFAPEST